MERPMNDRGHPAITRREAVQRVAALLGGTALIGVDRLSAFAFEPAAIEQAMAQGTGAFTAADVALLDEIAETILPATSTPGAKAAKVGAFMALMVTDTYDEPGRQVFLQGLRQLDDRCRQAHGGRSWRRLPPIGCRLSRRSIASNMRRWKIARPSGACARRSRSHRQPEAAALLQDDEGADLARVLHVGDRLYAGDAIRRIARPLDPDVPHAPGDKTWAPHA